MNVNTEKKDILSRAELKKMPFGVPDGYFSDFHKEALKTTLASNGHVRTSARLRPFAAAAAAFTAEAKAPQTAMLSAMSRRISSARFALVSLQAKKSETPLQETEHGEF